MSVKVKLNRDEGVAYGVLALATRIVCQQKLIFLFTKFYDDFLINHCSLWKFYFGRVLGFCSIILQVTYFFRYVKLLHEFVLQASVSCLR